MRVLVAGITGQLGAGLVEGAPPEIELIPLVRIVGKLGAPSRVTRTFPGCEDLAERAVVGDVTRPRWGLGEDSVAALAREVDVVLDLAAETNWAAPRRRLFAVNRLGAQHGLELAAEFRRRAGRCSVYCYASSVHAAGGLIGRVPEARFGPDAHRTPYEQSKWLAEELLFDGAARRTGLALAIARIGGLVGNSRTGATAQRNSLYRLASIWERLPGCVLPVVPDGRVDMLPRDAAGELLARALSGVAGETSPGPHVFHVCAGVAAPRLDAFLAALRSLDAAARFTHLKTVRVPYRAVRWTSHNADRLAPVPPVWRNALVGHRYVSLPRVFERDHAAALAGPPLPEPPIELLVRLAFDLHPSAADPVSARRTLARFAG